MIVVGAIALGVSVLVFFFVYNSIVQKTNEIANSEGALDAQLKQRYDLVPNLVNTAKKFMEHEKHLLTEIVKLRKMADTDHIPQKKKEEINQLLSERLQSFMVQVENYPELRSSDQFLNLQNKLYEIEENIAAARRYFNAAVTDYNNAIEMVPHVFLAKMMGKKKVEVFKVQEVEKVNPQIKELFSA